MSSFVKPVPNRFEHFHMSFFHHAKVYAIMEHIPKINHAHLRLILGFPFICDDVKWPSPEGKKNKLFCLKLIRIPLIHRQFSR